MKIIVLILLIAIVPISARASEGPILSACAYYLAYKGWAAANPLGDEALAKVKAVEAVVDPICDLPDNMHPRERDGGTVRWVTINNQYLRRLTAPPGDLPMETARWR